MEQSNTATFDHLLTQLGTGKWNLLYFLSVSLWFGFHPPQALSGAYLAPPVAYTCRPPPNLSVTISEDSCSYLVNRTTQGLTLEEEPCTEWDFDTSVFSSTLTSEFSLVCGREYLRATYQSVLMMSALVTSMACGWLADRFGRWLMTTVMLTVFTLAGLTISFLHNFLAILVLRAIVGCASLPTIYTLAMEVCETRLRSTVGVMTALPWAFGTMAWGGVAYLIRDWRLLQLTVTLPHILIFPALWLMDESPRWLIVRGHHDRALTVLQKAARWNNATLPPKQQLLSMMRNIQETAKLQGDNQQENSQITEEKANQPRCGFLTAPRLCRSREVSIVTIVMCVDYLSTALVFYGLNLNATNFSADPFIYMVLVGVMEVPSYSLTAPVIDRFGRKRPTVVGYFISGASILALFFIPQIMSWLVMTLVMVGKMCISASFQALYVYNAELFPTEVRIQGMGAAIMAARVGSIIPPFITDYLGSVSPWIPSLVFGSASLVACLATLAVRETLGDPLPDTISDLQSNARRKKRSDLDGKDEEMVTLSS